MDTDSTEFTRHDVPISIRLLLAVAQQALRLDTLEVYALAVNHGSDWLRLTDTLCNYGYANRHIPGDIHSQIVQAAERVWQELKPDAAIEVGKVNGSSQGNGPGSRTTAPGDLARNR